MDSLIIRLTGTVQSSNFDQWKVELIERIEHTDTRLVTSDDFAAATEQAKAFKQAEQALKQAKVSAIEQAADIQHLFDAIDEVAVAARQARLSLERQIKTRKQEIKEAIIEAGIETVHRSLLEHGPDFQGIDHGPYLNRVQFDAAIRGKASTSGAKVAVERVCDKLDAAISQRAKEVERNAATLAGIPGNHQPLFQDRLALIALDEAELARTIEQRIELFEREQAKTAAETATASAKDQQAAAPDPQPRPDTKPAANESFMLVIDILASRQAAVELAQSVRQAVGDDPCVSAIHLSRRS